MSKTSRTKLSVFLAAGIAVVILAAALSVFYGSTKIPFETVLQALRAPDMTDQQQIIIHELRIPAPSAAFWWVLLLRSPVPSCRA